MTNDGRTWSLVVKELPPRKVERIGQNVIIDGTHYVLVSAATKALFNEAIRAAVKAPKL